MDCGLGHNRRRQAILTWNSSEEKEPRHEISNNVVYAISKASDQPEHMRSLVRAFACRLTML